MPEASKIPYRTTNMVYGTTNADAGVGIGLLRRAGLQLAGKAIN